ncbi:hypothetical protein DMENIID0001_112700 [Sergentomyia squamirostris]
MAHADMIEKRCTLTNSKTDWTLFRGVLDDTLNDPESLSSAADIDEAVSEVTAAIQSAAWAATPISGASVRANYEAPATVREKVLERRGLRSRWQATRNPEDKAKFNKASRELKSLLTAIRDSLVDKYLSDLSPTHATDYSLWRATRRIKHTEEFNPPIKDSSGGWARTDKEKADVFAQLLNLTRTMKEFNPSQKQK